MAPGRTARAQGWRILAAWHVLGDTCNAVQMGTGTELLAVIVDEDDHLSYWRPGSAPKRDTAVHDYPLIAPAMTPDPPMSFWMAM